MSQSIQILLDIQDDSDIQECCNMEQEILRTMEAGLVGRLASSHLILPIRRRGAPENGGEEKRDSLFTLLHFVCTLMESSKQLERSLKL